MTRNDVLLAESLALAVPLEMARIAVLDEGQREWLRGILQSRRDRGADDMLYGGRRAAAAFADLTRSLALCAYQPGGVSFAGQHWCTDHTALCDQVARYCAASWLAGLTGQREAS